jgi:hypothetical protein
MSVSATQVYRLTNWYSKELRDTVDFTSWTQSLLYKLWRCCMQKLTAEQD